MTTTIEAPAESGTKKKPTKAEAIYRAFPHCSEVAETSVTSDGRAYHVHCPGAMANGAGSRAYCTCDCHNDVPRCADCRQPDVDLTLEGTCIDIDGCIAHQHTVQDANPSMVMINEIRMDLIVTRAMEAAEKKLAKEQAHEAEVARAKAEGRVAPLPPSARRREAKPPAQPQQCQCGCAGMTKGGRFVAGHDAKLKGRLVKAARQTPPDSGRPATKAEAIKAMAELIARDWPRKNVDTKITEQADALVESNGPDRVIEVAVAARYPS